jgi:hypothetical protein
MAKKAVKKATKQEKPKSPKAKVVRKTAPVTTEKKSTGATIARKTTVKKKEVVTEKNSSEKKTPKLGKGQVKIESSSKSVSDTSEMDKLDNIIYSLTKDSPQLQSEVEGRSRRGKTVNKKAKVEVATESGESRDKKQGHSSQESFMRKSAQQQVSGKVDTQSISEELSKLIKKIEVKKVQSSISPTDKTKKGSSKHKQKVTAKSVGYTVKLNPKNKATPVINLFDLVKKTEFNNTDIILTIIEIAYHRDCYIFPSSPKSNSFWEEIVQFNEFKRIFQFLRPETLKKYWRLLSWKDAMGYAIKIIEKHKKFLDEKKPK